MKVLLALLALAFAPSSVTAVFAGTPCALNGAADIGHFAPLETALETANVDIFLTAIREEVRGEPALGKDLGQKFRELLAEKAPKGFAKCQVILQRKDAEGMIQRVDLFPVANSDFQLFLYQIWVPNGLDQKLEYFTIDTSLLNIRKHLL